MRWKRYVDGGRLDFFEDREVRLEAALDSAFFEEANEVRLVVGSVELEGCRFVDQPVTQQRSVS